MPIVDFNYLPLELHGLLGNLLCHAHLQYDLKCVDLISTGIEVGA